MYIYIYIFIYIKYACKCTCIFSMHIYLLYIHTIGEVSQACCFYLTTEEFVTSAINDQSTGG